MQISRDAEIVKVGFDRQQYSLASLYANKGTLTMADAIIDSHIHLYAASHLDTLAWAGDLPPDHRLHRQNSVDEYRTATQGKVRGFVFLETDRKSDLDDWKHPLEELDFLVRIARGQPRDGEGHRPEDAGLVLGIIPWAPMPAGAEAVAEYADQVKYNAGADCHLIKGFRYLVQARPAGTMMEPKFLESLEWLGDQGLTFDLGVDARQGGLHQLREACEMMTALSERRSHLRIIVNHLCKPNLRFSAEHQENIVWAKCIRELASYSNTYMKLSGLFSELPGQNDPTPIPDLIAHTKPWIDVVFESFGPSRIMFGSDWPVCNVGGPGDKSWQHWRDFVEAMLESRNLTESEKARIWSGTAAEAYSIEN
jgi:L-rhamnono-1,4-lactonase